MRPSTTTTGPSGQATARALVNQAAKSSAPASPSRSSTFRMAMAKSFSGPAHLAECTPGWPPRAATEMPESSARAIRPLAVAAALALIMALPAKVVSGSSGSGRPSSPAEITWKRPSSRACSSRALPGLWVAATRRVPGSSRRGMAPHTMPNQRRSTISGTPFSERRVRRATGMGVWPGVGRKRKRRSSSASSRVASCSAKAAPAQTRGPMLKGR